MYFKTKNANIIPSDFPDLDVIKVDKTYYMVSTTMHFMPGCVILKSYNLLDWEFCSYVFEELESTDGQTLKDNKGIYGRGMWAASLRFYKGIFYIAFVANDTHKTYLFTSKNPEGPWIKQEIKGFYHDLSLYFENDIPFLIYGNTEIHITEMEKDLSKPKNGGLDKIIICDDKDKVVLGYEGCHFYKINNKYYAFFIHMPKNQMRTEACFVSDKIEGPYEGCDVLCSDFENWNSGVAQGGIVQSDDGSWFAILFQDHGALGRIPVIVPVSFENDFPVFGINNSAPENVTVLDNNHEYKYNPLYGNNFLNEKGKLAHYWQWNHIPDKKLISLTQNSFTVQTNKIVKNITQSNNTLTQRTFTEKCGATVFVDAANINNGDYVGIGALEGEYAFLAITKQNNKFKLILANHQIPYSQWTMNVYDDDCPNVLQEEDFNHNCVKLKIDFSLFYQNENVQFSYFSERTQQFVKFGNPVKLRYTLDQFVGVKFALFYYSTILSGGKAIFEDFIYNIENKL